MKHPLLLNSQLINYSLKLGQECTKDILTIGVFNLCLDLIQAENLVVESDHFNQPP